jgi:CO/xanthine dehydrogenase Mo-binding subunit
MERAPDLAREGFIAEARHPSDGPCTASFPNVEVEIDPDTEIAELIAYNGSADCGNVLQRVLVEGQVQVEIA